MGIHGKIFSVIYILCLFAKVGFAQLNVGDKAPEIVSEQSFPPNFKIPKGKPILLDFWATWCTPCVVALKESNAFVENYRDKIEFLCITDSSSRNMEEFIRKNNLRHQFLLNANQSTQSSFQVRGLPTAFLIDSDGIIQWTGNAQDVSPDLLDEFIATGKTSGDPRTKTISFSSINEESGDFSFDFKETETTGQNAFPLVIMGANGDSIRYSIRNTTLRRIIELLYENQSKRIIYQLKDERRLNKTYTLNVYAKHIDLSSINHTILEMVGARENFNGSMHLVDTVAWVLKTIDETKLKAKRTQVDPPSGKLEDVQLDISDDKNGNPLLFAVNLKMVDFQAAVSEAFDSLIYYPNEAETTGYDFKNINLCNWAIFQKQLIEEVGMELVKEKVSMPFLVIEDL